MPIPLQTSARDPEAGIPLSGADLLVPLEELARVSPHVIAEPVGEFSASGARHVLKRFVFLGPEGGGEMIRIGLFGGLVAGDIVGTHALIRFATLLAENPRRARGYCLFLYPQCDPAARVAGVGFWTNHRLEEIRMLERELEAYSFHGLVSLGSDPDAEGIYGFVQGATLTEHLLDPALQAAEAILPRDLKSEISGNRACNGIVRKAAPQTIAGSPRQRPKPFEITLRTPRRVPQYVQELACVAALSTVLSEYTRIQAHAANL